MEEDYLRLYRSLNENKVKYVIIGGIACVLYGSPRLTKDIDIFIERNLENSQKLLKALKEIGFGTASLTTPQKIIKNEVTIFKDYIRLDVLTKIKRLDFERVWKEKVIKRMRGLKLPIISLDNLIISKRAIGRSLDLEDIKILEKIRRSK